MATEKDTTVQSKESEKPTPRVAKGFPDIQPDTVKPTAAEDGPVIGKAPAMGKTSYLGIISEMVPDVGFVVVKKKDGTEEVWPATRVAAMAADTFSLLRKFDRMRDEGRPVDYRIYRQHQELWEVCTAAAHAAMAKRDSIGRHDTAGKAVDRMMTRVEWQKGARPELGAYHEEDIKEEHNIRYYCSRFPALKEGEIAAVLRAHDIQPELKAKMLSYMNGKRMAEELGMDMKDIQQMMTSGKIPEAAQRKLQGLQTPKGPVQRA